MKALTNLGRALYAIGIVAVGIHHLIIKDFRSEIFPPFPFWVHKPVVFPVVVGIALIFAGIVISGVFAGKFVNPKKLCLYLGFCFLVLTITCQVPYTLFFNPDGASRLDAWFGAGEELAYCGGAFVMAGSFSTINLNEHTANPFELWLEKLIPFGRIFFSILMILFGCSHFVFTDFVSTMVPKFMPAPLFWTYLAGIALIGSGIAISLKIWIRPVALLLAIMLFLFFIFFHIPDAIANPTTFGGNEIVRATVALLFAGICLVIAATNGPGNGKNGKANAT